jgi:hypothetical protein
MNFGPYDQTGDAESKLVSLKMTSGQRITQYIVHFNSLAPCCDWGDATLCHRFYEGLPNRLKDEVSRGDDGKPRTLNLMRIKAQNADARYRKPARPTPDVLRRQLTTSLQTTTPVTRITRNPMGNPTKDNNNLVDKPLDPPPKLTCLAS